MRALGIWLGLGLGLVPAADALGQLPAVVDGRVVDELSRPLRAVYVSLVPADEAAPSHATSTDETGYFRFSAVDPGGYRVLFQSLGYAAAELAVEIREGDRIRADQRLVASAILLEGVEVEGSRAVQRAGFREAAGLTAIELTGEEIRRLPALGESDPLRAVETFLGVISPSDFSASFNVRGGSSDQNLILLDGFPVFNPFHLGGVFSVFNSDMVDRVELQSGGFPARFGGRVSSVLSVDSDPGPGSFGVDAGVSLLAARLAVSGGLGSGTREGLGLSSARWRFSARRSYVDQLLRPVAAFPYHITDFQGVGEVWTTGGGRFLLTAYRGNDVLDLARVSLEDFPLRVHWRWGNDVLGLRWMRGFHDGGVAEAGVGISRFGTALGFLDFDDSEFGSEVEQVTIFASGSRWIGSRWKGSVGGALDRFRFDNLARTGGTTFSASEGSGTGWATFAQAEWSAPGAWLAEAGLRVEGWFPDPGARVIVPAPRLALKRFLLDGEAAVKVSAGRYAQFLHSLRDEELPLGIDIWVLAGSGVPHVVSDQLQIGVERFLGEGWFIAAHAFHRSFDGVVTNNLGDDPNEPDDDLLPGTGRGYGADLFVERSADAVSGSLALSWLKADRTFPDFQSGLDPAPEVTYPPIFDRRLDADLVLRFSLPRSWEGGLRWHLGTGLPYTRPRSAYAYFSPRQTQDGRVRWSDDAQVGEAGDDLPYAVFLGDRNAARYPLYHRLDLSFRRSFLPSWGSLDLVLDVLNVYNRTHPLFYFYDLAGDPPVRSGLSMFPFLPTLGIEARF